MRCGFVCNSPSPNMGARGGLGALLSVNLLAALVGATGELWLECCGGG